ncbi:molybdopterin-binding protein, partial [Candidatus Bathyarchaeota archaeon]|nr:molybdopterin-binding protein [Candidatus Bathyarchaeota archaeon]
MEDAKEALRKHFDPKPLGTEKVDIGLAVGRVLGEDVTSDVDVPPFDRASMDGYAIQAEASFGAEEDKPVRLSIVGSIMAGDVSTIAVQKGEAVEISTGAPVPKGANAVVMVEFTSDWNGLRVYKAVAPGENIMASGADIMAGELVLRAGQILTPRETGVLAAVGRKYVDVFRKPVVAILSTGNEIAEPGSPLEFGKIYDINGRTLADTVTENGGIPRFLGILGDKKEEIQQRIVEALSSS